ncbi:hypothetical protein ACUYQI_000579 [Salmonella enterica subsp. enterica serovar Braenderup]
MKRKLTISYEWSKTDGSDVEAHHVPYLEESAFERIREMIGDGYVKGQLSDNLHTQEDTDDHEGTDYHGWWTLITEGEE